MNQKYKNAVRTLSGSVELIEQLAEPTLNDGPYGLFTTVDPTGPRLVVVVVANDHPEYVLRCLRSIRATTAAWPDGVLEVVVVNNGSDEITSGLLKADTGLWDKLLTVGTYQGWLPAVVAGFENCHTHFEIVALVDPAVEVFDGCFERVLRAFDNDDTLGMATAWSSKQVPAFRGMSLKETAARFHASQPTVQIGIDVGFPSPAFVAFSRRAFEQVNGLQDKVYGPGHGAIEDIAMRIRKDHRVALLPGVLVRDESCWPVTMPVGDDGSRVLQKRWGKAALWEAAQKWPSPGKSVSLAAGVTTMMPAPTVVWVFRETVICGAVLLAAHVSNELIRLGWESTIACTRFDPGHRAVVPMDFGTLDYPNDQAMVKGLVAELPKGAVVIAPLWVTSSLVAQVCEQRSDLHPVYYVQDDEARFTTPAGEPYVKREVVEESYHVIDDVLANSVWVADLIESIIGKPVPMICPGVDPFMFRPSSKLDGWNPVVTVMAHCRPKTPRRGWAFIEAVMRRVCMSHNVRFVTYDEVVDECRVPNHVQLGRLSPDQLSRAMAQADIFLEGSDVQGFGMQALEAMATGLAVVCTDNMGIDTFGTSMHDCVVVSHDDVERAAAIICRLADKKAERKHLGHNARKVGLDFSWSRIGELWADYLKDVRNAIS